MLYDLTARIRYDYDPPAAAGRNLLRLMPADLPGRQRLVAGQITARPAPAERGERPDFWGNRVAEMTFRQPERSAEFTLRARVERMEAADGPDRSPPLRDLPAQIAAVRSLDPLAPHHFLGASPRVAPFPAVADYAAQVAGGAATAQAAVLALGGALHGAMAFDSDATTVDTSPEEAFALRQGVCQDFAHIMIAGLRSLGVPAGYVSGFLRTVPPPGLTRLEGADAMHAWVRAWCGAVAGWIEYDPTNACTAGSGHITVACGRDYDDVAPVQGVLRSSGRHSSTQSVDTRPIG